MCNLKYCNPQTLASFDRGQIKTVKRFRGAQFKISQPSNIRLENALA